MGEKVKPILYLTSKKEGERDLVYVHPKSDAASLF